MQSVHLQHELEDYQGPELLSEIKRGTCRWEFGCNLRQVSEQCRTGSSKFHNQHDRPHGIAVQGRRSTRRRSYVSTGTDRWQCSTMSACMHRSGALRCFHLYQTEKGMLAQRRCGIAEISSWLGYWHKGRKVILCCKNYQPATECFTVSLQMRLNIGSPGGMAERVGFEPTIPLQVCRISSAVRSTTLPPLRICWSAPSARGGS